MATTKSSGASTSSKVEQSYSTRDVLIRVDDLAKASQFYTEALGLTPSQHSPTLVGFETGAFTLYLDAGKPAGPIFEFVVSDIDAAKERLVAAGCLIIRWEGPHRWLRDPYGLMFNLRGE